MINSEFSEALNENIFININNNFNKDSLRSLSKALKNDEHDLFPNRKFVLNVNKD